MITKDPLLRCLDSFEKRCQMRASKQHPLWQDLWNTLDLGSIALCGDRRKMLRERHFLVGRKDSAPFVGRADWAMSYLESGRERSEFLKKNAPALNEKARANIDVSSGRTLADIQQLAQTFCRKAQEQGLEMDSRLAMNFAYSQVIEIPYLMYLRVINTRDYLQHQNPGDQYLLAKAPVCSEYCVDILHYDADKKLLEAFYVAQSESVPDEKLQRKHRLYSDPDHYGVPVQIIEVSASGRIL